MRAILLLLLLWQTVALAEPRSGYDFLSPEIRAMQDDDFENPGMLTVERGERLFNEVGIEDQHTCSGCHGPSGFDLDPARIAGYPRIDPKRGLVTLQGQIHHCWQEGMDRFPLWYDHPDLVALETFVRHLARGEPVQVDGEAVAALLREGEALYRTGFGQVGIACQQCHDQYQGLMLRGEILTQGHSNGFPLYRLGSGNLTSLHRRFNECFASLRAEPFELGSREYQLLELYLAYRSNGLPIETPAVRH